MYINVKAVLLTSYFLLPRVACNDFNDAFSSSLAEALQFLMAIPWDNFLLEAKVAFTSKMLLDWNDEVDINMTFTYLFSQFKPYHAKRIQRPGSAALNYVYIGLENGAFLGCRSRDLYYYFYRKRESTHPSSFQPPFSDRHVGILGAAAGPDDFCSVQQCFLPEVWYRIDVSSEL